MRSIITIAVWALAPLVSGCSTMTDLMGVPRAGYQSDGSYVLDRVEQAYTCKQIDQRISELERQTPGLLRSADKELERVPPTVQALFQRATAANPQDGTVAMRNYHRNEAEAAALKASRSQKGCDQPPIFQDS